jgi:hypothetical protein
MRFLIIPALALAAACTTSDQTAVSCDLDNEIQAAPADARGPLALVACPADTEIQRGEPVRVHVALVNVADSAIAVRSSFAFGAWLAATVFGPRGGVLEPMAHVDSNVGPPTILAPGQAVRGEVDLRCAVGAEATPVNPCQEIYRFSLPGEYRISMRYAYHCEDAPCGSNVDSMDSLTAPAFRIVVR